MHSAPGSNTIFKADTPANFEELESQIEVQAASLAANEILPAVVVSDPWGWHPLAIHRRSSTAEARNLAISIMGGLIRETGRQLSDASFRIIRRDGGVTCWDRDFGVPSSVLRIPYGVPREAGESSELNWHFGVAVGKVSANHFLVWDWGD